MSKRDVDYDRIPARCNRRSRPESRGERPPERWDTAGASGNTGPLAALHSLQSRKWHLAHYRKDRTAAAKLVRLGESTPDAKCDVGELAAYTTLMGLILNLDEVISKE